MKYVLAALCGILVLFMGGCAILTVLAFPLPLIPGGIAALNVAILGALFTLWAAWPVVLGEPLRLRPSLVLGLVLIVLGIQFLSLGFLGELIAGTRTEEPEYAIRERI